MACARWAASCATAATNVRSNSSSSGVAARFDSSTARALMGWCLDESKGFLRLTWARAGPAPGVGARTPAWSRSATGAGNPLGVRRRTEDRVGSGHEAVVGELGPEVGRVRVGNDFAGVAHPLQARGDELVHPDLLRAAGLDDPVDRLAARGPADGRGDVVGRHRLEVRLRQVDLPVDGGGVGDRREELEELGGADDRVGEDGLLEELI